MSDVDCLGTVWAAVMVCGPWTDFRSGSWSCTRDFWQGIGSADLARTVPTND